MEYRYLTHNEQTGLAFQLWYLMCKVPNVGCQAAAGGVACLMVCKVLRCGCLLRVRVIRVVLSWVLKGGGGGAKRVLV
jgi:hypothetical protein